MYGAQRMGGAWARSLDNFFLKTGARTKKESFTPIAMLCGFGGAENTNKPGTAGVPRTEGTIVQIRFNSSKGIY